jgi:plasmid stability protein
MRGITIKLPEATLRRLDVEAKATGRSIAAVVRERLDAGVVPASGTLHELAGDLAGALAGRRLAATNERRKFRRG